MSRAPRLPEPGVLGAPATVAHCIAADAHVQRSPGVEFTPAYLELAERGREYVAAMRVVANARAELGDDLAGHSVRDLLLDQLELSSARVDAIMAAVDFSVPA